MKEEKSGRHKVAEDKPERYECTWIGCSKSFVRKSDLVRHNRIHLNDRPHVCMWPGCNKAFLQNCALQVHLRTHTGERPLVCGECGKTFSDSSSLCRHKKTHLGQKPFVCQAPNCGKAYTRKSSLAKHVDAAHGPKNSKRSAPFGPSDSFPMPLSLSRPLPTPITPNSPESDEEPMSPCLSRHGSGANLLAAKDNISGSLRRSLKRPLSEKNLNAASSVSQISIEPPKKKPVASFSSHERFPTAESVENGDFSFYYSLASFASAGTPSLHYSSSMTESLSTPRYLNTPSFSPVARPFLNRISNSNLLQDAEDSEGEEMMAFLNL